MKLAIVTLFFVFTIGSTASFSNSASDIGIANGSGHASETGQTNGGGEGLGIDDGSGVPCPPNCD